MLRGLLKTHPPSPVQAWAVIYAFPGLCAKPHCYEWGNAGACTVCRVSTAPSELFLAELFATISPENGQQKLEAAVVGIGRDAGALKAGQASKWQVPL